MKMETRLLNSASVYELMRTGHGSIEGLARVGLSRDDLDLKISEAARRAGLAEDLLTRRLETARA